MDKLIEKITIEGAEFEIIQKPATLYAGYKAQADNESVDTFALFQAGHKNIIGSLTPDTLHCQETFERNQPDGIEVVESPECLIIKSENSRSNMDAGKESYR